MKNSKRLFFALLLLSGVYGNQNNAILLSYFPTFFGTPVANENEPYDKVTHFCWAFAGATSEGKLVVPREEDVGEFSDSVKAHGNFPLLSLGGAGSINQFKSIMKDSATLIEYIDTLISFCENYNLSGVEVNWEGEELLTWDENSGTGWNNFTKAYSDFVIMLGQKLHEKNMTIGVDVYGGSYFGAYYPGGEDSLYINTVDRMLVMTGGLHGKWELNAWQNGMGPQPKAAPPGNYYAVKDHIEYWLNRGVPKEKLISSFVSSLSGYNTKGADRPGESYYDIGTQGDLQGIVFYKKMLNLIDNGTFQKYGGGKRGSFLYSEMNNSDSTDSELIMFNTFEDIRYAAYEIMKLEILGVGYWMTGIDLPSEDSLSYVNALIQGINSDTLIAEPSYIPFPKDDFIEPSGEKINLLLNSLASFYISDDSEATVTEKNGITFSSIKVAQKTGPDHWPGGIVYLNLSDSCHDIISQDMDTIMLVYKSNESMLFNLDIDDGLIEKGWSHMVEIPSTFKEIDTLLIPVNKFEQPAWTGGGQNKDDWLIDMDIQKLISVSFSTNNAFGKTTDLEVYEVNGYQKPVSIIKNNLNCSLNSITIKKFNTKEISFIPTINDLYNISIISLNGKKIYSNNVKGFSKKEISLNITSPVSQGMYLLKISNSQGNVTSKNILIK